MVFVNVSHFAQANRTKPKIAKEPPSQRTAKQRNKFTRKGRDSANKRRSKMTGKRLRLRFGGKTRQFAKLPPRYASP